MSGSSTVCHCSVSTGLLLVSPWPSPCSLWLPGAPHSFFTPPWSLPLAPPLSLMPRPCLGPLNWWCRPGTSSLGLYHGPNPPDVMSDFRSVAQPWFTPLKSPVCCYIITFLHQTLLLQIRPNSYGRCRFSLTKAYQTHDVIITFPPFQIPLIHFHSEKTLVTVEGKGV